MKKIRRITTIIVLILSGCYMIYTAGTGLIGLVKTFSSEGFSPFLIRTYLIPYYAQGIAMIAMLYSGILCFFVIFQKNSYNKTIIIGVIGIIASLIPRIFAFFMFGNFSMHYMIVFPICVLLIGIWNRFYLKDDRLSTLGRKL